MQVEWIAGLPTPGQPALCWLGQAGFWIETGTHRLLVDPYLSDSLARKHAGEAIDYRRMEPPPFVPGELPRPDLVLVTHAHTDHMDPDTLGPLAGRFPGLPFVVPASKLDIARQRIGPAARLIAADAGDTLTPLDGVTVMVFPASHETLECDSMGRHVFLGYGLAAGEHRIYHSGDCIPFAGLVEKVMSFAPDYALLPVNGRDSQRLAAGVPGNFTLGEAIALAIKSKARFLLPHHFGMFAINTLDETEIDAASARNREVSILKPRLGETVRLSAS
jgi:L-ascorbate metabolism protein UlaG (beta-lactamase superfamily)